MDYERVTAEMLSVPEGERRAIWDSFIRDQESLAKFCVEHESKLIARLRADQARWRALPWWRRLFTRKPY